SKIWCAFTTPPWPALKKGRRRVGPCGNRSDLGLRFPQVAGAPGGRSPDAEWRIITLNVAMPLSNCGRGSGQKASPHVALLSVSAHVGIVQVVNRREVARKLALHRKRISYHTKTLRFSGTEPAIPACSGRAGAEFMCRERKGF